jgi:hypothetical protein
MLLETFFYVLASGVLVKDPGASFPFGASGAPTIVVLTVRLTSLLAAAKQLRSAASSL